MSVSKKFVTDLAERAVKTFVQVFLVTYAPVVLGAGSLGGLSDLSVASKAATAGIAAVFSIVLSLVSGQSGDKDSASLVK